MAASDAQSKKRKGATDSQPKAKKARKSDDIAAAKPTRKEAADFFSDDDTPASVKAPKSKKSKKSKATEPADAETAKVEEVVVSEKPKKKAKKGKKAEEAQIAVTEEDIQDVLAGAEEQKRKEKKTKKPKKAVIDEEPAAEPVREEVAVVVEEKKPNKGKISKKQKEAAVVEDEEAAVAEDKDAEEEEALDDQTAALLAGFESDRDESDLEKEDEEFDEDALAETGKEISKKKRKELEKARRDAEPGVIYLGRIPHGFFEPQMKKYFSQFGTVLRLRLSRNKKTGASKHYAFVEFANGEVADIVAKTMHNYLMFGHILQCRVVPSEQVHAELFKGANERFKVDPRNQKEGAALARGATRDVWEKRVQRENKKRAGKAKALLEEFDYEFNAPAVKSVDSVPKKTAAIEDAPAQALLTQGQADAEPEADTASAVDEAAEKKSKKASKNKKRKSDVVPEAIEEPEVPAPKSKKVKKESQPQSEVVTDKKRKVSQNGPSTKKVKKAKA